MKNYKNTLKVIYFLLYFFIVIVASIILLDSFYNIFDSLDNKHNYYVAIIILITSIATGSFFLIRLYIENQLGIKEKEMIKEYQNALDKQTKEQNIKFDNLENNLRKDFQKQNQKIDKIIDWMSQQKDSKK